MLETQLLLERQAAKILHVQIKEQTTNTVNTIKTYNACQLARTPLLADVPRESVLFIGTQFSNLYTAVDTPAMGCVDTFTGVRCVAHHRSSSNVGTQACADNRDAADFSSSFGAHCRLLTCLHTCGF
jgi:hypothetical protein